MSTSAWRPITVGASLVLLAGRLPDLRAQGNFAPLNDEELYYEVEGQGPPLVLIHGWTLNLRMWDLQIQALSQHFRVVRYDRRGFGKSSGDEDVSWDALDLKALLDHLGIKRAHILGMSQGGRVALRFARDFPNQLASLILHGTPAPEGFGLPWNGPDRLPIDEWRELAREQGLDAWRHVWATHPLMDIPVARPEVRARLAELLAAYRGGRLLKSTQATGPTAPETMDDLPRINVPTLILVGDTEVPFFKIVAYALTYYMPKARVAIVPGGGHMVNLIEPGHYNEAVLAFLQEVERTSAK